MADSNSVLRRLLVTVCAATHTTELAARWLGTAYFLPALFTLRYANMGGLDREVFARQLDGARSFTDDGWCGYWNAIAEEHLQSAQRAVDQLTSGSRPSLLDLTRDFDDATANQLADSLSPGTVVLAENGPQNNHGAVERLAHDLAGKQESSDASSLVAAAIAADEIVKAITYFQVSAFPGNTSRRIDAYWRSRRLFDALVPALRSGLGASIERFRVAVDDEVTEGWAILPPGDAPVPAVLVTNGLEGTVQELAIPFLRQRDSGNAVFMMEMPGTYAHARPMSTASEAIYHAVIDHVAQDPRVDAKRIGMVGISFGGHWSARMAARSPVLKAVVACGAPTHLSFKPGLGTPEIFADALAKVTGTSTTMGLLRALRALSIRDLYSQIAIPLLVINGERDTLLSTQDSIDLATAAPQGLLKLYPDDDHCAMGHYAEWGALSHAWLAGHLAR